MGRIRGKGVCMFIDKKSYCFTNEMLSFYNIEGSEHESCCECPVEDVLIRRIINSLKDINFQGYIEDVKGDDDESEGNEVVANDKVIRTRNNNFRSVYQAIDQQRKEDDLVEDNVVEDHVVEDHVVEDNFVEDRGVDGNVDVIQFSVADEISSNNNSLQREVSPVNSSDLERIDFEAEERVEEEGINVESNKRVSCDDNGRDNVSEDAKRRRVNDERDVVGISRVLDGNPNYEELKLVGSWLNDEVEKRFRNSLPKTFNYFHSDCNININSILDNDIRDTRGHLIGVNFLYDKYPVLNNINSKNYRLYEYLLIEHVCKDPMFICSFAELVHLAEFVPDEKTIVNFCADFVLLVFGKRDIGGFKRRVVSCGNEVFVKACG